MKLRAGLCRPSIQEARVLWSWWLSKAWTSSEWNEWNEYSAVLLSNKKRFKKKAVKLSSERRTKGYWEDLSRLFFPNLAKEKCRSCLEDQAPNRGFSDFLWASTALNHFLVVPYICRKYLRSERPELSPGPPHSQVLRWQECQQRRWKDKPSLIQRLLKLKHGCGQDVG